MSEAVVAKKGNFPTEVEAGKTYAWCSCGQSKNQPFCDGSHSGTDFSPIVWVAEETKTVRLCGCKHSKKGQFCDGAHSSL